ncbi:MAG: hypothetical protein JNL82_29505 [Myxococcales bacterium]|nr:hypothetical protein [Myxococcales bacterium]
MEIVVVRNDIVGGVGRTTIAAHLLFFAAELGLKVVGASIDERNDLCPWMRPAGIRWIDALSEELPTDVDLIVIDVGTGAKSVEVLRPSLTIIPVDRAAAEDCARATAETIAGEAMRLRNYSHGVSLSDEQLSLELRSLDVVLTRCDQLAVTGWTLRPVWASPLGAASAGARAMRELAAEVLHRVGLLPPEHVPYMRREPLPSFAEREKQGSARLAAFFDRFAAMKKEEAETCEPKPWMVAWARGVEASLAGK